MKNRRLAVIALLLCAGQGILCALRPALLLQVAPTALPLAQALSLLLLAPLTWWVAREGTQGPYSHTRRHLFNYCLALIIVLFALLPGAPSLAGGVALYCLADSASLFTITPFWGMLHRVTPTHRAQRLFSSLTSVGEVGGLLVPLITAGLLALRSTWALSLGLGIAGICLAIAHIFIPNTPYHPHSLACTLPPTPSSPLAWWRIVARSPAILSIAGIFLVPQLIFARSEYALWQSLARSSYASLTASALLAFTVCTHMFGAGAALYGQGHLRRLSLATRLVLPIAALALLPLMGVLHPACSFGWLALSKGLASGIAYPALQEGYAAAPDWVSASLRPWLEVYGKRWARFMGFTLAQLPVFAILILHVIACIFVSLLILISSNPGGIFALQRPRR